ncbi:MAG: hypothetical protein EA412_01615 [Chitinophagaceae bacterium]|nr:MAG: hypothetical protein EA412_01615 [Chitinophagaceae bacterium]
MRILVYLFIPFLLILTSCKKDQQKRELTIDVEQKSINEFQIIGSHNSYRKMTYEPLFDFVMSIQELLPDQFNPEQWDYFHYPLQKQLQSFGIRNFELDIFNDPQGGNFYYRRGLSFVNEDEASGIDELLNPGFKILHLPDFDYETHNYTFKSALTEIRDWSTSNPNHFPIIIMVEAKNSGISDYSPLVGMTEVIPYDATSPELLDAEVKEVFGENLNGIITPDKFRGDYASINEALKERGWPKLADARGKILFVIQGSSLKSFYLQGRPNLEDRAMFIFGEPGQAHTAMVIRNNPVSSYEEIKELVKKGYIVRTRADANTDEARSGDTHRRDIAFASGAQIISTDYYRADPRSDTSENWSNYEVSFDNEAVGRWNPMFSQKENTDFLYIYK